MSHFNIGTSCEHSKAHSYKKLLRYDRSQEPLATIADDGHTIESSQPMGKIRTQNCVNPGTQIRGYHAISNIKTKERILISRYVIRKYRLVNDVAQKVAHNTLVYLLQKETSKNQGGHSVYSNHFSQKRSDAAR